jgi:hypothetical protein
MTTLLNYFKELEERFNDRFGWFFTNGMKEQPVEITHHQ